VCVSILDLSERVTFLLSSLQLSRISISSDNALFVVLELHDEGLNIFALALPLRDGLLGIRVEVLLLLVEERLSLDGVGLLVLELLDGLGLLGVSLGLDEVG